MWSLGGRGPDRRCFAVIEPRAIRRRRRSRMYRLTIATRSRLLVGGTCSCQGAPHRCDCATCAGDLSVGYMSSRLASKGGESSGDPASKSKSRPSRESRRIKKRGAKEGTYWGSAPVAPFPLTSCSNRRSTQKRSPAGMRELPRFRVIVTRNGQLLFTYHSSNARLHSPLM
jgi:hypothetical protein